MTTLIHNLSSSFRSSHLPGLNHVVRASRTSRTAYGRGEAEGSCGEAVRNAAGGKRTRAGLISPSGWSSRSGSTRCPFRQNFRAGRSDGRMGKELSRGSGGQEEQGVAMETSLRNPQRLTTIPKSCFRCCVNLRDTSRNREESTKKL